MFLISIRNEYGGDCIFVVKTLSLLDKAIIEFKDIIGSWSHLDLTIQCVSEVE